MWWIGPLEQSLLEARGFRQTKRTQYVIPARTSRSRGGVSCSTWAPHVSESWPQVVTDDRGPAGI